MQQLLLWRPHHLTAATVQPSPELTAPTFQQFGCARYTPSVAAGWLAVVRLLLHYNASRDKAKLHAAVRYAMTG